MAEYCEICGEELDLDKEYEGICKSCKKSQEEGKYKSDEDFVDPGIT
jgi:hypothetical protein